MDADRLSLLLGTCIVPGILDSLDIPQGKQVENIDALYQSELYESLSNPATGMWHLSPHLLADLYREERETGHFETPEEQS
jgi:hypothetical protein